MSGIVNINIFPLDTISDYEYYDTPDGHDVHLKVYYFLKHAFRYGSIFMTYDILGISKPVGWVATLDRFWYLCKPITSMALAYPLTANVSCLIRKKDDEFNHALAAAAVCGVLGHFKGAYVGCYLFLPFAIGVAFLKHENMNGYQNYPESFYHLNQNSHYSMNPNVYKNDYSIFEQRPKGWVTQKNYESS